MEEIPQAVLKSIEDDPCRHQLQLAQRGLRTAIQGLSPNGVLPDALVREVLEALCAQTQEALSGLWEFLGTPAPRPTRPLKEKRVLTRLQRQAPGGLLPPRPARVGVPRHRSGTSRHQQKGLFEDHQPQVPGENLGGREGPTLPLRHMGLSDLEDAIEALLALGEGEERVEGGYILARSGGFWALWRGTFLGDPNLDVALLAGQKVGLPPIEGVALSFKVRFMCSKVYVDRLDIGWEEGSRHIRGQ